MVTCNGAGRGTSTPCDSGCVDLGYSEFVPERRCTAAGSVYRRLARSGDSAHAEIFPYCHSLKLAPSHERVGEVTEIRYHAGREAGRVSENLKISHENDVPLGYLLLCRGGGASVSPLGTTNDH